MSPSTGSSGWARTHRTRCRWRSGRVSGPVDARQTRPSRRTAARHDPCPRCPARRPSSRLDKLDLADDSLGGEGVRLCAPWRTRVRVEPVSELIAVGGRGDRGPVSRCRCASAPGPASVGRDNRLYVDGRRTGMGRRTPARIRQCVDSSEPGPARPRSCRSRSSTARPPTQAMTASGPIRGGRGASRVTRSRPNSTPVCRRPLRRRPW